MTDIKVLVACNKLELIDYVTCALETFGYTVVGKTQYGYDCISLANKTKPDVVLLEVFLYDFGAAEIVERLKQDNQFDKTTLIVISDVYDSSIVNDLYSKGVDKFLLMPADFISLDKTIRNFVADKQNGTKLSNKLSEEVDEFTIREHIYDLMTRLGFSFSNCGTEQICVAVVSAIKDKTILSSITKYIYPLIAKECNSTVGAVEHAMRHSIEKAWMRGDSLLTNKMFGYSLDDNKKGPSNAQYIAALTEKVKSDLKIK